MRPRLFTFLFLVQLLIPAPCQAEFYVIGSGGRIVGTEIKSLPYTIEKSGFYYITRNLTCPEGSHGIIIHPYDVTLDLMGFSLIGPGTGEYHGIFMYYNPSIEIRNGSVTFFGGCGIFESSAGKGHHIFNIQTHHNGGSGIFLNGQSHTVKHCTSCLNGGNGIRVGYSSLVLNNTTYYNDLDGIVLGTASSAIGNTCFDNKNSGISSDGEAVSVLSNTCYSNSISGITTSKYSIIKENNCYRNSHYGIYSDRTSLIVHNSCNLNSDGNIYNCDGCSIMDNIPASVP